MGRLRSWWKRGLGSEREREVLAKLARGGRLIDFFPPSQPGEEDRPSRTRREGEKGKQNRGARYRFSLKPPHFSQTGMAWLRIDEMGSVCSGALRCAAAAALHAPHSAEMGTWGNGTGRGVMGTSGGTSPNGWTTSVRFPLPIHLDTLWFARRRDGRERIRRR